MPNLLQIVGTGLGIREKEEDRDVRPTRRILRGKWENSYPERILAAEGFTLDKYRAVTQKMLG